MVAHPVVAAIGEGCSARRPVWTRTPDLYWSRGLLSRARPIGPPGAGSSYTGRGYFQHTYIQKLFTENSGIKNPDSVSDILDQNSGLSSLEPVLLELSSYGSSGFPGTNPVPDLW